MLTALFGCGTGGADAVRPKDPNGPGLGDRAGGTRSAGGGHDGGSAGSRELVGGAHGGSGGYDTAPDGSGGHNDGTYSGVHFTTSGTGGGGYSGVRAAPHDATARLYGVTIDSVDALDEIVVSLHMLARRPIVRIVFDPTIAASDYEGPVKRIHSVAGVMGELLDSQNVASLSVAKYSERTTQYLDALGNDVDVWEIGNEVNGEWLGKTADVRDKIANAFQLVHARGKLTALTLFYNQNCWESADHEMFAWANSNVSPELKTGLDYVLISFYDDNCKVPTPDWNSVFARLAKLFPNARVGFGECGTTTARNKAPYIRRYYGLQIDEPHYIGGYFWWYYRQDMVPYTTPLWSVLNMSLQTAP